MSRCVCLHRALAETGSEVAGPALVSQRLLQPAKRPRMLRCIRLHRASSETKGQ